MDLYINDEYIDTLFDGTLLDLITNPDKYYDKYVKNTKISRETFLELISDVKTNIGKLVSNIINTFDMIERVEKEYRTLENLYGKEFENWFVETYFNGIITYDENENIVSIVL